MRFLALVFAATCFLSGGIANAQQTVRPCTTTADQTNCLPVAAAQPLPVTVVGAQGGQTSVLFTSAGANTWSVPAGVTLIYVDGCGAGGGGGAGGATVSAAGGGAGGGGQAVLGYPLNVTPGATLTITIPAAPAGGTTNGNGTSGSALTITGSNNPFPSLGGGAGGTGTTGATGGAGGGGGSGGSSAGNSGGGAGGAAAANGSAPTLSFGPFINGAGGGGGGSTASAGGRGGVIGVYQTGQPGSGNAAGGGGANSVFGNGGAGGSSTPTAGAAPTIGFCGGGGGGGPSNTVTGNGGGGAQGFALIRY